MSSYFGTKGVSLPSDDRYFYSARYALARSLLLLGVRRAKMELCAYESGMNCRAHPAFVFLLY